jgi:hypothetical protein
MELKTNLRDFCDGLKKSRNCGRVNTEEPGSLGGVFLSTGIKTTESFQDCDVANERNGLSCLTISDQDTVVNWHRAITASNLCDTDTR